LGDFSPKEEKFEQWRYNGTIFVCLRIIKGFDGLMEKCCNYGDLLIKEDYIW